MQPPQHPSNPHYSFCYKLPSQRTRFACVRVSECLLANPRWYRGYCYAHRRQVRMLLTIYIFHIHGASEIFACQK